MTPFYVTVVMLAFAAMIYIIFRQHRVLKNAKTLIAAQDEKLHDQREKLANFERDSHQSNALFSTIFDVAYDYAFVLDEENTIIALNRSAETLFDNDKPIGDKLTNILDAPELEDMISRIIAEDEGFEEQFVMKTRHYRVRAQIMRYDGGHVFIGFAMQDITQLVRLNRARRDMVANISHELRTPITKIRFVVDNIFYDRDRPKRQASIESLRAIGEEVGALENVVQELLDLSMIESGQAIMKLVDEPLSEIVDAAVERLEGKLERKELKVVQHVPEKLRVLCDRDHIRRVITNLVSNAIKWSPEKDVITVSTTIRDEDIVVSVFDNGPGVPEDQRQRIFERFYQVDTARSGGEGSGLGLALCKHIIEAHGGEIWAEGNAQGHGGRFLFTLLNSTPKLENEIYMDRGQHDVILTPSPNIDSDDEQIQADSTTEKQ
jgi:two-component system, OmpR family, phosphate regulon sensor histidine kinase PhoR